MMASLGANGTLGTGAYQLSAELNPNVSEYGSETEGGQAGLRVVPQAARFYRPGLDVLRVTAFAFIFVTHGLVDHLDQPTRLGAVSRAGEFGVCIFFFLSSYLITELLLQEKDRTKTIQIKSFYVRRVLRIWPLYFGAIALAWAHGLVSPEHYVSGAWLAAMLLVCTNFYIGFIGNYAPGFLFTLWSIAIEEQYYLVWPFLVRWFRTWMVVAVACLVMVASYARLSVLLTQHATLDTKVWTDSLVQFQFFALGALVALVVRGRVPNFAQPLRWVFFIASLLCFYGAQGAFLGTGRATPSDFQHIAPCYAVALFGCVFLFLSMLQLKANRLWEPLIYLGRISYGLYVYHVIGHSLARRLIQHLLADRDVPVVYQEFMFMALALPVTIVIAGLSYRFFEGPILKLKKRFTVISSRPA